MVLGGKQTSLLNLSLTVFTMDSGDKLASNNCPTLSIYLSSFMCLSMTYESFHFSTSLNSVLFEPGWLSSHQLGRSKQVRLCLIILVSPNINSFFPIYLSVCLFMCVLIYGISM